MNKFTLTKIPIDISQELKSIDEIVQSCTHKGEIMQWDFNYDGQELRGSLCQDCGQIWGTKK